MSVSYWPTGAGGFGHIGIGVDTDDTQGYSGKERDTESGLDYFGARYYASNMGRFMSPDWSAKAQAVPYAKLTNPQTLNLYGYMQNNPTGGVDQDGHCDWCQKLANGLTGNGFVTNDQLAALNAPTTITVTEVDELPTDMELGPGMAEAIESENSNSLVDYFSSAAGLVSATPKTIPEIAGSIPGAPAFMVGLAASLTSANNDASHLNLSINGTSTVLGGMSTFFAEGTATATVGTVGGFGVAAVAMGWSASNFMSNIVTSVFSPRPEANNVNGITVQQPDMADPGAYGPPQL